MDWTTEYEFEELQLTLDGIRLDTYVSGTAILAIDPCQEFYVQRIVLDGKVKERTLGGLGLLLSKWRSVKCILDRPEKSDASPQAAMFRLIEEAIYSDEDAIKAWAQEREAA